MNSIVMTKLSYRQPIAPVVLLVVHEHRQEFSYFLIDSFCLPIRLRVIRRRGVGSDFEYSIQFFHELRYELWPSVANHLLGYSVFSKYVIPKERSRSVTGEHHICRDEVGLFCESIHYYQYRVEPFGFGKGSHHVD